MRAYQPDTDVFSHLFTWCLPWQVYQSGFLVKQMVHPNRAIEEHSMKGLITRVQAVLGKPMKGGEGYQQEVCLSS